MPHAPIKSIIRTVVPISRNGPDALYYSGTSDNGHSEKRTTSVLRTTDSQVCFSSKLLPPNNGQPEATPLRTGSHTRLMLCGALQIGSHPF